MDKKTIEEITEELCEALNIVQVLKIALDNINQPDSDTCHYAYITGEIEAKLNNILDKL